MEPLIKKPRSKWTAETTDLLIDMVEKNYSFLFETGNPCKTKRMVHEKWKEISLVMNCFVVNPTTVDQIKRKWYEIQFLAKKKVSRWKKCGKYIRKPSDCDFRVFNILSDMNVDGIHDTSTCEIGNTWTLTEPFHSDTSTFETGNALGSLEYHSYDKSDIFTEPTDTTPLIMHIKTEPSDMDIIEETPVGFIDSQIELVEEPSNSSNFVDSKKPPKRDLHNHEFIRIEKIVGDGMSGIKNELEKTNLFLGEMVTEMKRTNTVLEKIAAAMSGHYSK